MGFIFMGMFLVDQILNCKQNKTALPLNFQVQGTTVWLNILGFYASYLQHSQPDNALTLYKTSTLLKIKFISISNVYK